MDHLRRQNMDIPIHAEVRCADEPCGTSFCVILNPITDQITHFVVKEKSFPFEQRLVPVDQIKETTSNTILLKCGLNEFLTMPEFIETKFVFPDPYSSVEIPSTMLWPYTMILGTTTIEHEKIPPDELAIHRGSQVMATDGRVGQVDEFMVEPKSGHITHLVLREGHLWSKKDISIPVSRIDHIEGDNVYLKISKSEIESLPTLPIDRSKWK
jgi:sporulation protein YlmC with PRC-barrel domain